MEEFKNIGKKDTKGEFPDVPLSVIAAAASSISFDDLEDPISDKSAKPVPVLSEKIKTQVPERSSEKIASEPIPILEEISEEPDVKVKADRSIDQEDSFYDIHDIEILKIHLADNGHFLSNSDVDMIQQYLISRGGSEIEGIMGALFGKNYSRDQSVHQITDICTAMSTQIKTFKTQNSILEGQIRILKEQIVTIMDAMKESSKNVESHPSKEKYSRKSEKEEKEKPTDVEKRVPVSKIMEEQKEREDRSPAKVMIGGQDEERPLKVRTETVMEGKEKVTRYIFDEEYHEDTSEWDFKGRTMASILKEYEIDMDMFLVMMDITEENFLKATYNLPDNKKFILNTFKTMDKARCALIDVVENVIERSKHSSK